MFEEEEAVCAICGTCGGGDSSWFIIVENHWQDKLKVLHWNEALAWQPGVRLVCCSEHVRELVVHWMATGSMDYPFAMTSPGDTFRRRKLFKALRPIQTLAPDLGKTPQIGELAIHRESMERILRENPQALAGVLDALLVAMADSRRKDSPGIPSELEFFSAPSRSKVVPPPRGAEPTRQSFKAPRPFLADLVRIERLVLIRERLQLLRQIFERHDRIRSAHRHAGAAVNTAFGIDIHLGCGLKLLLVLLRMNTVGGANVSTELVFNAGISNYISHGRNLPQRIYARLRLARRLPRDR